MKKKGKKMFSHLIGRGDVELLVGDINRPVVYSDSVDYIIHGASATSSNILCLILLKQFIRHWMERQIS